MTGMEYLKQRLMDKYDMKEANVNQALNGVTFRRVLEIFAEERALLPEIAMERLNEREKEAENKFFISNRALQAAELENSQAQKALEEAQKERQKAEELKKETEQIIEVETPEARDRLRMMLIFRSYVSIRTPQNNTAYISGLASILSGSPMQINSEPVPEEKPENKAPKKRPL